MYSAEGGDHSLEKVFHFNLKPWDTDNCQLILVKEKKKDFIFKHIFKYDKGNFLVG